ncbi:uncharacterized protein LOC128473834 [Spea bombifrons]|uniref:uncharacterized protein LOC128473834 n=1 Tax=Spea bombifrons TaxID=233779 RepID=UPI00234A4C87|nr:uncharacterized protein LOC128473834 [Spea bombifrons]
METFLECESIPIHSSVFQHPFISRRGISDSFHIESNGKNTELEISDNLLLSKATFTCLPSLGESSISASGLGRYALVDQVVNTEDEYQYKPCGSLVDNSLSNINTTLRRTRVIKHKPSAITFPDISLETKICEILDDETTEGKLSIDEEVSADDDDDVFTDLPTYHLKFTGIKRRRSHPRNRNGNHLPGQGDQLLGNIQCENDMAEEERKRKKLTEERSQWNKSMISLMMKLEQLNVDIEDAITATASFSHVTFSDVPKEMIVVFSPMEFAIS